MGTNYYGRIIPTKEQKEEIKDSIDKNDFTQIRKLIAARYYGPSYDYEIGDYTAGEIHLGKRSAGWKFLWNPNWYKKIKGHTEWIDIEGGKRGRWVQDGFDIVKFYDLTKESIKKFIDRDNIEIYNEYDEKQDKEEFWNMALNWGYNKDEKEGWDGEAYEEWEMKQNPNYKPIRHETDYSKFLESCGFKLNKYKTDFYSDGLRFATCTDFS